MPDSFKIDFSWYVKPDSIEQRFSCGGVVCRVDQFEQIKILLTHEKDDRYFVLPKGGIELGETELETAIREVHEETGIQDLTVLGDLGRLERLTFKKNLWSNIHFFLFYTRQIIGVPTDVAHTSRPRWFALEDQTPYFWPDQQRLVNQHVEFIRDLVLAHHREFNS